MHSCRLFGSFLKQPVWITWPIREENEMSVDFVYFLSLMTLSKFFNELNILLWSSYWVNNLDRSLLAVQKQIKMRTEGKVDGQNTARLPTCIDRASSRILPSSVDESSKGREKPMSVKFALTNENPTKTNDDLYAAKSVSATPRLFSLEHLTFNPSLLTFTFSRYFRFHRSPATNLQEIQMRFSQPLKHLLLDGAMQQQWKMLLLKPKSPCRSNRRSNWQWHKSQRSQHKAMAEVPAGRRRQRSDSWGLRASNSCGQIMS